MLYEFLVILFMTSYFFHSVKENNHLEGDGFDVVLCKAKM